MTVSDRSQKILSDFYPENEHSNVKHGVPSHPLIVQARRDLSGATHHPRDLITTPSLISDADISTYYWNMHSSAYVKRLGSLVRTVDPAKTSAIVSPATRAVICIAAMNEENIDDTIMAIKTSYGSEFEDDIQVVIYNNYKEGKYSPLARRAIHAVQERHQNVTVITEKVATHCNTGSAKKVATDLVMKIMRAGIRKPLVSMDGDVANLSSGCIQDAISALEAGTRLAAAPGAGHQVSDSHPVMKFLADLATALGVEEAKRRGERSSHMTFGMCWATLPRYLMCIGGIRAHRQFEDEQVTQDFKDIAHYGLGYVGNKYQWIHPVEPLNLKGHVVRVSPERELSDVMKGKGPFSRWNDEDEHFEATDVNRFSKIPNKENMLFDPAKFDEENIVIALNHSEPLIIKKPAASEDMPDTFRHFNALVSLLEAQGIHIKDADLVLTGDSIRIAEAMSIDKFIRGHGRTADFLIRKIRKIEIRNRSNTRT